MNNAINCFALMNLLFQTQPKDNNNSQLKTEHFPSPPQQWVRNSNAPPEREMVRNYSFCSKI